MLPQLMQVEHLVPGIPANTQSDIRFVNFLGSRLNGETVILLAGEIDGASILPAVFERVASKMAPTLF
jgi:hypothetical protein